MYLSVSKSWPQVSKRGKDSPAVFDFLVFLSRTYCALPCLFIYFLLVRQAPVCSYRLSHFTH